MSHQRLHLFLIVLSLRSYQTNAWSWFSSTNKQTMDKSWDAVSFGHAKFSLQTHNNHPKGIELVESARTKMVSSNSCWQIAYRSLFSACSDIIADKETQSRLAWYLSDCFQRESGRSPFPSCDTRAPMVKCLKSLDEFAHKIYLEFFLETNFICHQLQGEAFKHETERLVNKLAKSAQNVEDKLDNIEGVSEVLLNNSNHVQDTLVSITLQTQEVAQMSKQVGNQIDNLLNHSKAIYEESMKIAISQLELQEGQVEMKVRMEAGIALLEESYENLYDGMKKLKENAMDIERKIQVVGDSIALKMQNLQRSTDEIANVSGMSLEKQKLLLDGQSEALKGLTFLTNFLTQALEESRATLHELAEYGQKQQDELLRGQEQLKQTHDHLFQNSKSILDAQEDFKSKQANMFITLDKLFMLLNSIVLESRFIKTSIHYFGVVMFAYWLTSAKQISHVRAHFYLGICLTFAIEFMVIRLCAFSHGQQSWVESNMFWLRSTFLLLIALTLSLHSIHSYRDYEQLNYQLLLAFRDKIEALEKSVVTMYLTLESDADLSSWVDTDLLEDDDIFDDPDYILPEVVAENSVTSQSLSTKYDLRPRRHK